MSHSNRQFTLSQRPSGLPKPDAWQLESHALPEVGEGQMLVRNHYISLDPAMRGWMNEGKSYIEPVALGEVMRAGTVGRVMASRHPRFAVGDHVCGPGGVQEYALSEGHGWYAVDASLAPLPVYLGTLGMPGMTAYFGLLEVGKPKEGETVLVSAAAGAVGSVVGQVAKIKGCRAVGLAGGPEKCAYLVDELGFDAAIDYKGADLHKKLREACPKGVDVYFDNVGGDILDLALSRINRHARIVICGAISQYNSARPKGPDNYLALLVSRAVMQGMVVFDYADRYPEAMKTMGGWMAAGRLKSREHLEKGLERFPEVFLQLFSGKKMGKLVLDVTG